MSGATMSGGVLWQRWLDPATEYCFTKIEAGNAPEEGHELPAVPKFLDYAPDQDRVAPLAPEVAAAIEIASFVRYAASSDSYGVTPLDFAPRPNSLARGFPTLYSTGISPH